MRPTWIIALSPLLAVCALPGRASALPVFYGDGDTISYVADLPADSDLRKALKPISGDAPKKHLAVKKVERDPCPGATVNVELAIGSNRTTSQPTR
jgi:hypothetical protein